MLQQGQEFSRDKNMPSLNTFALRNRMDLNYNPFDLLRIYTFYRIILGAVLLLMFQLRIDDRLFGGTEPQIFYLTSISYTLFNVLFLIWMWRTRFNPSTRLLFSSLMIDIAAYTLLMHSSGGALSGLSYLLLIAIAAGGIMLPGPIATLQAAITTIVIVGEGLYRYFLIQEDSQSLFASSLLGTLAFAISVLFQHLSHKIRLSHEEAIKQAEHAQHLQNLAHSIIERMHTGIMVLGKDASIQLMNHAASQLLNAPTSPDINTELKDFPELYQHYQEWIQQRQKNPFSRQHHFTNDVLKVNFTQLHHDNQSEVILFLEDIRSLQQQAQRLKLASLGRLTASIAHEVRNPLGAISHAAQLLQESETINPKDERLLGIINTHSKRVNLIIDNVLNLSRRKHASPSSLELTQWLSEFITDYSEAQPRDKQPKISLFIHRNENYFYTNFDESQLRQILTNLCDNGLRYSKTNEKGVDLTIELGHDKNFQQPFIRIIDYGEGVSAADADHLFEPFFTTENTGSGLGLYICRELCEANQAFISYCRIYNNLSCFHIQLSHPQRAQNTAPLPAIK